MRRFLVVAFTLVATLFVAVPAPAAPRTAYAVAAAPANANLQFFATESGAQAHCPSDTVVWLNTNSGIYHEKGMRWYGRTKHGAYVCKKEADAAGDRDTRNGQ